MATTTTTTTCTLSPEEKKRFEDRRRFGGYRYSLRAPDARGPNDVVTEETSNYTFPKKDDE